MMAPARRGAAKKLFLEFFFKRAQISNLVVRRARTTPEPRSAR
jgi:hypothetical protein